jgi:hypothetical protein
MKRTVENDGESKESSGNTQVAENVDLAVFVRTYWCVTQRSKAPNSITSQTYI